MSRRARQRREAIESRYVAMLEDDDTDEADWEDADYKSLRLYDEIRPLEYIPGLKLVF